MKRFLLVFAICITALCTTAKARQIPEKISYQGVLTYVDSHGKTKAFKKGTYLVTFKFWDDPTAGNLQDFYSTSVNVGTNGVYTVTLGDYGINQGFLFNGGIPKPLTWMELVVSSGLETHVTYPYTIAPRTQFTSVPYAFVSKVAASLPSGIPINASSVNMSGRGFSFDQNHYIKMEHLTGTVPGTTGGHVDLPHGLDHAQILSISVLVQGGSYWMESNWTSSPGYEFHWYENIGQIHIDFVSGNDNNLLNQPIQVLITYAD